MDTIKQAEEMVRLLEKNRTLTDEQFGELFE